MVLTKKDIDNLKSNSQSLSSSNSLTKKDILNKTKIDFYNEIKKYQKTLKPTKEIEGYGASAIVGEKNYPQLKIYNSSNEDKESSFLNTNKIVKQDYSQIIKHKAKNILGNTNNIYIKKTNDKVLNQIQDIYKARKEVEFTSKFESELKFNKPIINKLSGILGTKNELLNVELNENAKTSKQIEKYSTDDTKSKEAIISLYEKGINESQIINLLTLGNFGVNINKKIVPTRWAITAYDKTIENHLYTKILKYKLIKNYELYFQKDKGNSFLIILLPDTYSVENYEFMVNWEASDYVGITNKLKKSEPSTAGGLFATKLAINEHLNKRKKQAQYICLRFIDNYEVPLGVVFVRETIREAMKNKKFSTSNFIELKEFIKKNYNLFNDYFLSSQILKEKKNQKKINDYYF
jgi:hypothetical protein